MLIRRSRSICEVEGYWQGMGALLSDEVSTVKVLGNNEFECMPNYQLSEDLKL